MVATPSQTDTYSTALDIFDKTHPLRVDMDENLKVTGTFTPTGTQDVNVISSVPIQVSQSGTWVINLATEPTIDIGKVDQGTGGASPWLINVNNFPATVAVTGPLTDSQLRATPVPVSGTITANAGTGTLLVDGSAHTQPISGTVTATQGTSPWVVSGSITTSPNVNVHDGAGTSIGSTGSSLNVSVTNTVPVSGTITANAGTGTFIVDGSGHTQPISAVSLPLPTGAATEATLSTLNTNVAKEYGTWAYYSGTSGTVTVSGGQRVIGIGCHSTAGGTIVINGGSSVPVPANVGVSIEPRGNLTAPSIVFTSTDSYFVEVVS